METNEMRCYVQDIKNMKSEHYTLRRKFILEIINGDVFYPINTWPATLRKKFFKKPLEDKDTMVVLLFLYGKY